MSVPAILHDLPVARHSETGRANLDFLPANRLNFADILFASGLEETTMGLSIGPAPGASEAHPRTETHRSVSILGHFRTTVITFTDGTTDVQTVAVNDGQASMANVMVAGEWSKRAPPLKANSDLEPEVEVQRPSQHAFSKWKARNRPATGSTAIRTEHLPGRLAGTTAQDGSVDVGNLIDLLG